MNYRSMTMTMVLVLALPAAYAAADPASPTARHAGTPTLMMHNTVLAAGGMMGGGMSGGASVHGDESIKLKDGSMLTMDSAGGMMMNDAHGMHMDTEVVS